MKIEIGATRPAHFKEYWPGQFELFSHFEFAAGIPQNLFAIATVKKNGKPNICLSMWSTFSGNKDGYYAILGGVSKRHHTYDNIMRTGEFTINFLSADYDTALDRTTVHNGMDDDEFAAGGFTVETSKTISAPRIGEAFLTLECTLEKTDELPDGSLLLVIGKVRHLAMQEEYAGMLDAKYGEKGFVSYISSPTDLRTGDGNVSAFSVCNIVKKI